MKGFLPAFLLCSSVVYAASDYAPSQEKRAAAAEALAAVGPIFEQVAKITNLPMRSKVASEIVTREQIRGYIEQRMKETTPPEQIHAQEVAFIKFGLLPAGFHLQQFLVDLLSEQATAFYDPKQKKFFLSDWAPLDMQKPAIAHELTHALQDQLIDLDRFLEDKSLSQDQQAARMAVVEGEGVLAMMEYMLAPAGRRAADVPGLSELVVSSTQQETAKFPVFAAAPQYLRESLLFPYTFGLTYVQAKAVSKGASVYSDLLKNPPHSTHDVLHPSEPSVTGADLQPPAISAEGYKKLDTNTLGEFDVMVLLKLSVGESSAKSVSAGWRGFRYGVYESAAGGVILAHRSKWKDADAARQFAEAYRKVVAKKGGESDTRVEQRGDVVDVVEGVKLEAAR